MGVELNALLERANRIGVVPTRYEEDSDGTVYEVRTQDVEPLLRKQHERAWTGQSPWSESRDLLAISEIPMVVAEQWCYRNGIHPNRLLKDDDDLLRRFVNDPDNRAWRKFN